MDKWNGSKIDAKAVEKIMNTAEYQNLAESLRYDTSVCTQRVICTYLHDSEYKG